MDLLELEEAALYFDQPVSEKVAALIEEAAEKYGEPEAECLLLKAYFLQPEHLTVIVALYRFYFYSHNLESCLVVADKALTLTANILHLPLNWQDLTLESIQEVKDKTLLRFYLFALKGAAYVNLRLDRLDIGEAMIDKVLLLDTENRLGAKVLKDVLDEKNRLRVVK